MDKIYYTLTDEAPSLASYALLKILKPFLAQANVDLEIKNISLAARILAVFPDKLLVEQQVPNALQELGELVKTSRANIIKLPNISASMPQLLDCIKELQSKGFELPDYPIEINSPEDEDIRIRYDKIKGSAVNPVLREGNSDRRAPKAVKDYVKKYPHFMGKWTSSSKTHVASMSKGDFYETEKSLTLETQTNANILFTDDAGIETILRKNIALQKDEIIDCSVMSMQELEEFLTKQVFEAKEQGVLFSLHMKATMMKVSDPIIFGATVRIFYRELFANFKKFFTELGINANNGLGDVYAKIKGHTKEEEVKQAIRKIEQEQAEMAMVNSDLGITNLHIPSDIIIDASMPAMIRNSGKMWNKNGELQDTKAVIPDRSYSGIYQAAIDFCKTYGAFDPTTMGSTSNIGLMAQKAEEYGSHDKTFQAQKNGVIQIVADNGKILLEQKVSQGDIFRMCQVKDLPVQNWISLAIDRSKETQTPAVFWLDSKRAHDQELIKKINHYLEKNGDGGGELLILSPIEATTYTMKRMRQSLDTISVTGNVLRDYLTDLFPILELGTSAKMLSIVPLLNGGGLFETGAGGSAPKHIQQFLAENHLRWDSLGEYLALAVSLDFLAKKSHNSKAQILSQTLDLATSQFLAENKSPSRKVKELDNRGAHFYLVYFWAKELSQQNQDAQLKEKFTEVFKKLQEKKQIILENLLVVQGQEVNIGGYYFPQVSLVEELMNPSTEFNSILQEV